MVMILLLRPSATPLVTRCLQYVRTFSWRRRNIRATFFTGSSRLRIAQAYHFLKNRRAQPMHFTRECQANDHGYRHTQAQFDVLGPALVRRYGLGAPKKNVNNGNNRQ